MSLSDIRPLRSSKVAQQLGDQAGGVAYAGGVEGDVSEIAFGGPTADFILYGVVNGAFAQGPPNPAENIDPVNNPMPYWSGPTQVSGGAITCTWVADSASASGYNLRFTVNPGAASDEAYFEQVVPIAGTRQRVSGHVVRASFLTVDAGLGFDGKISLRYLTAAGVATGNAVSTSLSLSNVGGTSSMLLAYGHAQQNASPPGDAAYLRIQVGVVRGGAAVGDDAIFDLTDVRVDKSAASLIAAEQSTPDSYSAGLITQSDGVMNLIPNGVYPSRFAVGPNGLIEALGAVIHSGIIYPTLGANANDYAPTGLATCSRVHITVTGAARTITGFDATGFVDGQEFSLLAISFDIVLADASGSSASGNRIKTPASAGLTVREGGGVRIVYDTGSSAANPFRVLTP